MTEIKRTDAATRKHHPFSPSSLQPREVSPYYTSVQGDSEASRAGTRQHDAVDSEDLPEELSDVQAEAVMACKTYWGKILLNFPGGIFINEEYLNIDDQTIVDNDGTSWHGTTGGYLDRGIVSADRKRAAICDWKFGQWSVEPAETNLQGFSYALGILIRYPSIEEIEVHFYLPHRNEVTTHTFKRSETVGSNGQVIPGFEGMYLRVRATVLRAAHASAELKAAKTHVEVAAALSKCKATVSSCLFCANIGRCPLVAEFALKVGKKFHPVEVPESTSPTLISDPEQARLGLEVASLVKTWAEAYRSQATNRAIEHDDFMPEGYRLRSRSDREIVDRKKAEEIAKKHGVTDEQIDEARSIKLTPLFKAVRATAVRGEKENAEDALSDALIASGAVERSKPIIFLERLKA